MTTANDKKHTHTLSARVRRRVAIVSRWLHIYLSMVTFGLVLFFSVTGLTLNHVEWFDGAQKTVTLSGEVPTALLAKPDELRIVEHLRNTHHIRGAVGDTRIDDQQYEVTFKGPGYSADAAIDRTTGKYNIIETRNGFWAVMNDLHKGRDTGKAWGWVIDISAVLLVLVSLTGLALIFFLYKKRTAGLIVAVIGTIAFIALYKLFVP